MSTVDYELEMGIQECFLHYGLPGMSVPVSMHVETSIGGIICDNGRTESAKMIDGHVNWKKRIVTHFRNLEPSIPIIISFSLYRKRVFKHGFKLIGTSHLYVVDLIPKLNKGITTAKLALNMTKKIPATGYLLISLQIKEVVSQKRSAHQPVDVVPRAERSVVEVESHSEPLLELTSARKKSTPVEDMHAYILYMRYVNTLLEVLFVFLVIFTVYNTLVFGYYM